MSELKHKGLLHGVTLKMILIDLEAWYGWVELGEKVDIRCFTNNPSMTSSLKFLRKTPWARKQVEYFYLKALTSRK
ncbi:MAG: VF530 family protein [Candidatus Omnitrophota bacterium]|nr:VF530 family protein [Candidatus Omnitrophota bacterium]